MGEKGLSGTVRKLPLEEVTKLASVKQVGTQGVLAGNNDEDRNTACLARFAGRQMGTSRTWSLRKWACASCAATRWTMSKGRSTPA